MEMEVSVPLKKRERDWTNLPPELIGKIAAKLKDYADSVRFRAVCKTWRSAPRVLVDVLPPQLPWLCLPAGKSSYSTWYMAGCRFFNPSEEKYYTFKPHGPSKKIHEIPFDGRFIFTSTRNHVTLCNPITGSRITLPPLPGRAVVIRKASCVKCQDGEGVGGFCVIALGIKRTRKFYLYRSVDGYWNEFCDDRSSSEEDVTYYKGSFIFVTGISKCVCYDISTNNITPITIDDSTDLTANIWHKLLLVQSSSGELLMLKFRVSGQKDGFEVFKLVLTEQKMPMWSKVRSIGDDAIFINYSRAICIDARGLDRCRSNCIYFNILCPANEAGPGFFYRADEVGPGYFYHVYLFDIGDERVEKVSNSPHEATNTRISWIIPHLC